MIQFRTQKALQLVLIGNCYSSSVQSECQRRVEVVILKAERQYCEKQFNRSATTITTQASTTSRKVHKDLMSVHNSLQKGAAPTQTHSVSISALHTQTHTIASTYIFGILLQTLLDEVFELITENEEFVALKLSPKSV